MAKKAPDVHLGRADVQGTGLDSVSLFAAGPNRARRAARELNGEHGTGHTHTERALIPALRVRRAGAVILEVLYTGRA